MGKQLLSSEQSIVHVQESNPGCMWGILKILDYHHWHNVKKVFPHKKHYRGRYARYKRKMTLHNHGEDQQLGVAEAESLLVRQHSKNATRCRKKGPHTENKTKEEKSKGMIFSFHGESEHSESSDKFLECKPRGTMDTTDQSGQKQANSEYAPHPEKDGKTTEAALNQKLMETNKLNIDISNKFKKHTDVLEEFRVEKDLLLKFLRDLDAGGKNFRQASYNKARLTKSGSFPLTTSSQMRNIGPSTLKDKQSEIWAFPKGEKLLAGTQAPKMSVSSFAKDISYVKPMPLVSDLGVDTATKQKESFSSSRSSQGFNHKGWNQVVLHRFKVIKQKIKHALTEFKKGGYQTSVEAFHHGASPEYSIPDNEKEVSQSLDDGVIREYIQNRSSNETKSSDYDSKKHEVHLIRRTSSLTESLDRYTQLFEQSFSKDINWRSSKSKSLKLTNGDKIHMSGNAPKLSKRNLSLPDVESLGFILHEALCDSNDIGITVENDTRVQRKSVSLPLNKDKSLDHFTETEIAEKVKGGGRDLNLSDKVVERSDEGVTCDRREDIHEPALGDESFYQEKVEISNTIYPSKGVMAILETGCEENTNSNAEGRELNARGSSMEELETDLPNRGSVYSLPGSLGDTNASVSEEGTNKSHDNHFLLFQSDTDNDSNFNYVKKVLEFSGFMENDQHIQMRYIIDQPPKPSLLKDLDACLRHEIESSEAEIFSPYDHQLLFNLVNEVLLEMFEKSPTYFPRPFSFNRRLHPMPKGHYLLNEVWAGVNSYLSLRPELDQTLDDVVGRDLAKSSGWMNLQQEEECVALDLEEMILEDLLGEVIFS